MDSMAMVSHSEPFFDLLPEDLIRVILRKLPLKALGRCTSVSKSFSAIINSSTFIYSDPIVARGGNGGSYIVVHWNPSSPTVRCTFGSGTREWKDYSCSTSAFSVNVAGSFLKGRPKLQVVGSCKGLICLKECSSNQILLWNPLIKKSFILPETGLDLPPSPHLLRLGLGFDSKENDYKVLMIPYSCPPQGSSLALRDSRALQLYSLKSDSWRAVSSSLVSRPTFAEALSAPLVFSGGSLHFLEGSGFSRTIVRFDFGHKSLRRIALPAMTECMEQLTIAEYDGGSSIALMVKVAHTSGHSLYQVWVMREYDVEESWVRLNLEDVAFLSRIPGFKQSGGVWIKFPLSECHRLIHYEIELGGTVSYGDLNAAEVTDCGFMYRIRMTDPLRCSKAWEVKKDGYEYIASIAESLALLDRGNRISDSEAEPHWLTLCLHSLQGLF